MVNPRVLVVEDESVVAKDLQHRLRKLGYDVPVTVASGEDAIIKARETQPQLVLMDIRLKGKLDGIETAHEIRRHADVPVIFLTAYADDNTLGRAKLTEPFGYVLKPFEERELHTAIQVALYKHQAERELRKSERWLSATLRSIGDGVIAVNGDSEVVFMNSRAERLTGYSGEEATEKKVDEVFQIVNARNGTRPENPLSAALNAGSPVTLEQNILLVSKDGAQIPIEDSASPIRDDRGLVTGAVLVFRDVSQRQQAENALRASEERFRLLVEGVKDYAIFMIDPFGLVVSWNNGAERLKGYRSEEILGADFSCFYIPEEADQGKPAQALATAATTGSFQHQGWRVRKDGSRFFGDVLLTSLRTENGDLLGFVKLTRDITDRKKEEEHMLQMQKLESLGILAGGIAHDFNNLLTGILGNCSMALETLPEGSANRTLIEHAMSAGERCAALTQQLLSYAGRGEVFTRTLSLSTLVRDISTLIRTSLPKKVSIHMELGNDIADVEADPGQLQQVIMNLIINGAESFEDKEGSVTVKTGERELRGNELKDAVGGETRPGRYVYLEVADTGCGMDGSTAAKIFDPFFTTKFQGRGLGLSSVLGIVRKHKGSLTVLSQPGAGSAFTVLLPAISETVQERVVPVAFTELNGSGTILVVDDEEAVRSAAKTVLQAYGYTILLAVNGLEGVELYRSHSGKIRLVLLDLTMPVLNGEETLMRLREIDPAVRVMLSSGYSEHEVAKRFLPSAFATFIQKPYTGRYLAEKVKQSMGDGAR